MFRCIVPNSLLEVTSFMFKCPGPFFFHGRSTIGYLSTRFRVLRQTKVFSCRMIRGEIIPFELLRQSSCPLMCSTTRCPPNLNLTVTKCPQQTFTVDRYLTIFRGEDTTSSVVRVPLDSNPRRKRDLPPLGSVSIE